MYLPEQGTQTDSKMHRISSQCQRFAGAVAFEALLSERPWRAAHSLDEADKDAARVLALSPSTVRTRVESIYRKLECSTRAAATLKALTAGLI
jgi:DNA-binding NarL/FixJ family response regulator